MSKVRRPFVAVSGDYASLTAHNASFYYGYECAVGEGDDEEWCFEAKFNDNTITIPYSKLVGRTPKRMAPERWDCEQCLLLGIGWVLTKYKIGDDNV